MITRRLEVFEREETDAEEIKRQIEEALRDHNCNVENGVKQIEKRLYTLVTGNILPDCPADKFHVRTKNREKAFSELRAMLIGMSIGGVFSEETAFHLADKLACINLRADRIDHITRK